MIRGYVFAWQGHKLLHFLHTWQGYHFVKLERARFEEDVVEDALEGADAIGERKVSVGRESQRVRHVLFAVFYVDFVLCIESKIL
jgi:hypothetical protein